MTEPPTPTVEPTAPDIVGCPECERDTPAGQYCGVCGAHLFGHAGRSGRDLGRRPHSYAADPHEHVLRLSVVSTLFPHLPRRRSAPFREAFFLLVVALAVLGGLGLTAPSIAVAVGGVPLLYLVYLYDAEVYEDEPLGIAGLTFGLGIALGVPWAFLTEHTISKSLRLDSTFGLSTRTLIVVGVLIPAAAQLLMLAGPLVVYLLKPYNEALDGFAFGAACALGFTLAVTLVNLWPELGQGLRSSGDVETGALRVLQRGLLGPVVAASTTGMVAAAFWLRRGSSRDNRTWRGAANVGVMLFVALAVHAGLGIVNLRISEARIAVGIHALVAAVLLLFVRIALHTMLLAEATEVTIGPTQPCSHCHHVVPRMAFCVHCGIATRATPKSGTGRDGRGVR